MFDGVFLTVMGKGACSSCIPLVSTHPEPLSCVFGWPQHVVLLFRSDSLSDLVEIESSRQVPAQYPSLLCQFRSLFVCAILWTYQQGRITEAVAQLPKRIPINVFTSRLLSETFHCFHWYSSLQPRKLIHATEYFLYLRSTKTAKYAYMRIGR